MHAIQSSKLASLFSQSQIMLTNEVRLAETITHQFWTLSKCRFQRWLSALTQLKNDIEAQQRITMSQSKKLSYHWTQFQTVAEEILISELLLRSFVAIANAKYSNNQDIVAVSKTVLQEHTKIRGQVEALFVLIPERGGAEFKVNLVELAQCVRSSNDFLLGHFSDASNAIEFAFNKELVAELLGNTASYTDEVLDKIRIHVGKEMFAGLSERISGIAFTPDLNEQIANCTKSCFTAKEPVKV